MVIPQCDEFSLSELFFWVLVWKLKVWRFVCWPSFLGVSVCNEFTEVGMWECGGMGRGQGREQTSAFSEQSIFNEMINNTLIARVLPSDSFADFSLFSVWLLVGKYECGPTIFGRVPTGGENVRLGIEKQRKKPESARESEMPDCGRRV